MWGGYGGRQISGLPSTFRSNLSGMLNGDWCRSRKEVQVLHTKQLITAMKKGCMIDDRDDKIGDTHTRILTFRGDAQKSLGWCGISENFFFK